MANELVMTLKILDEKALAAAGRVASYIGEHAADLPEELVTRGARLADEVARSANEAEVQK